MMFKPRLTDREMQAVANLLLAQQGVNVDPIIKDLYPQIKEEDKSLFRCKLALLLNNRLPEFKPFEGFTKTGYYEVLKLRCIGESSLLGTRDFEVLEVYGREETKDNGTSWKLISNDSQIGATRREYIDYRLFNTIEEAVK